MLRLSSDAIYDSFARNPPWTGPKGSISMNSNNTDHGHILWLATLAKAGDRRASQELCERFAPLVHASVRRYREHVQEREDLLQVGYEALLRAVREYEPEQGVYFAHFVKLRVRAGVYAAVRRSETRQGREFADQYNTGTRIAHLLANAVDARASQSFQSAEWNDLFHLLSARERIAIEWTVLRDFSTKEVADIYGVSKETVKTWRKRALKKLYAALLADGAPPGNGKKPQRKPRQEPHQHQDR